MFEKQLRRMKMLDWAIAKLGIISFVLFIVVIWPAFRNLVFAMNPWILFVIAAVCIAVVEIRIWRK